MLSFGGGVGLSGCSNWGNVWVIDVSFCYFTVFGLKEVNGLSLISLTLA